MGGGFKLVKEETGISGVWLAVVAGLFVPLVFAVLMAKKKTKQRGERVTGMGEEGDLVMRNRRFKTLVQTPWEGAATSIPVLFEQVSKKYANSRFLGSRRVISREVTTSEGGRTFEKLHLSKYEWQTYREVFDRSCNFSSGLAKFGHDGNSPAAIFADTKAEWIIAFQGCLRQNVTVVTMYASLGEDALIHSMNETQVSTLICDSKLLKKVTSIISNLETVKRIIYIGDDGISDSEFSTSEGHLSVSSFADIEKLGKESPTQARYPSSDDIAVIMYTSGSTGLPKGVMMTHGNIVATASAVITIIPGLGKNDVYLAYLPLAHVLELVAELVMLASGVAIGYGSTLTLTDSSNKIKKGTQGDVSALKPTLMAAVPAILDRVREGVWKKVHEKGGITKKLFDFAYKRRLAGIEGSWFGAWGLEKIFWDVLVFKEVRSVLGGQIRFMLCGGAPLSGDTQRFINICIGTPIGQGYGLTETCAAATFSEMDDTSVGRVGPPLPCCYVKLVSWEEGGYMTSDKPMPRGEVAIGGHCVTRGYLKNEAKTEEVYTADGKGIRWFYTGDIGQFHPDGCLEIIDRKKDIVKLQHGEYISLGKVEAVLISSKYVENIMVHADPFHSYCVALVVLSRNSIETWARNSAIEYRDVADLCEKKEVIHEVHQSLLKAAKEAKLDKFEIPSKLKLLAEPWTPESGLVTAALKLKREQLKAKFKDELAKLYA